MATPTTSVKQNAQNVVAVSITAKTFIKDSTSDFIAPSKSKPEGMNATEREIVDGLVRFVEKFSYQDTERFVQVVNPESGELEDTDESEVVEVDEFDAIMSEVMAERMETTRTNGTAIKLKNLEAEHAALLAELAALRGESTATPPPLPQA